MIGNGGRKIIDSMIENGLNVLNGRINGDWDGEFTYVGAGGSTVIDYVFVNELIVDKVTEFKVEERVDSDHMPVCLKMEETEEEEERSGRQRLKWEKQEEQVIKKKRICWDPEAIERYKAKTEDIGWTEGQEEISLDRKWNNLKNLVQEAMTKKVYKIKKRKIGHKDWWDKSCTRRKREVKKTYRKWRKSLVRREVYIEQKKSLRLHLDKKRKEKRDEEEKTLKKLRTESEVWNFINKKRKRREWKEANINLEVWRRHFMKLLGGEEKKREEEETDEVVRENRGEEKQPEELEQREEPREEPIEEEIIKVVRKAKMKKAAGIDGIPMEAWRYGGEAVKKGLTEMIEEVWKRMKIPEEWRKSIVVPIYKRGNQEQAENYRRISLLCTAYKIYAEIIREKLEKEVEEKDLLPESQAGFRKEKSTLDNIYVLNHVVQREKEKERGERKVHALFIDLKAAFDNVDRKKLWKILEKKGISEGLIKRMKNIYAETEVMIRTEKSLIKSFLVNKGVRQGCVLSPTLFNLYVADLEEELREQEHRRCNNRES
ncbi:golgin subfamily A member 6-like protein 6 [Pseudomyrmex gracilis]|uniref:golgin subfamily A member 6-like protein 6 n=1 Tax=Pseudomyrmex gracilis TaxID=219809 RepID=UPI000994F384|nr:golgin subfamily A member 6-like protein 6 [Pseudomyrmex gracilis]